MPTASTSNILNNFESFEPITHNIFMRRVLSGEYSIVNKYLIEDLRRLNLWNTELFNEFKKNYGSIQNIDGIPQNLKDLYNKFVSDPKPVDNTFFKQVEGKMAKDNITKENPNKKDFFRNQ
jgi:ribonucleotide reductase alpha subunit